MKIVKAYKNRSDKTQEFGVWAGKTLLDQEVDQHASLCNHGGVSDRIDHVKIGYGDAFVWLDDMEEVRRLGEKLVEIAKEAKKREGNPENKKRAEEILDALRSKDFTNIRPTEPFMSFGKTYTPTHGKVRHGELYGEYSKAFQSLKDSGKIRTDASGFIEIAEEAKKEGGL